MEATGLIVAVMDGDVDTLEDWNRWYDLDHVPPNVQMPGVMLGHRYVATPDLYEARSCDLASPFAMGRGLFLTTYVLCGAPGDAFDYMTDLRDKLVDGDRMRFPAEKKAVREGDVYSCNWAVPSPDNTLASADVVFVGHTGIVFVQRNDTPELANWYRNEWSPRVVSLDGVHGVASFSSVTRENLALDVVYTEGSGGAVTEQIRKAARHHPDADVRVQAPFDLIVPLHYEFVESIVASDLPRTVN